MPDQNNPFDSFDQPQTNAFDQFDAPAQKPAGVGRKAADLGLSVAKGVVAVPEAAVGLADIVTGGAAGRTAERLGVRFKDAKQVLTDFQSDDLKAKQQQFQQADGILDKAAVAIQNPSLIANTVAESLPAMGAGGVIGRGVAAVAPGLAPVVAGAIGEGAIGAGSAAEQIRQESPTGDLTGGQAALAAGSGVGTAVFGVLGGKVANRLGVGDVDTMLVQGTRDVVRAGAKPKGVLRRVGEGAAAEGLLEEVPQSLSEQAFQNAALDRPLTEGMADAAVMGGLAGGVMGGVAGGISRPAAPQPPASPPPGPLTAAALLLPGPGALPPAGEAIQVDGQGTAARGTEFDHLRGTTPGAREGVKVGIPNRPIDEVGGGQGRDQTGPALRLPPTVNVDTAGTARAPGQNVQPLPPASGPIAAAAGLAQIDAPLAIDGPKALESNAPVDITDGGKPFRTGFAAARAAKAAGPGYRAVPVQGGFVARRDGGDVIDVEAKEVSGSLKVSHETLPRTVDDGAHQAAASPNNDLPEPTKAQILAGNAKLGHAKLGGLSLSFESPAGSVREDKQNTPPKWRTPMEFGYHYGYFKRTEAADSSEAKRQGVDAFVKAGLPEDYSGPVFVVDQVDPKTGAFDEHKVMVGPANEREAMNAYRKHYEPGWKGGVAVTRMAWPDFKEWVRSGKKELPAVIDPSAPAAAADAPAAPGRQGDGVDAPAGRAGGAAAAPPPAAVAPAPKPAKTEAKGLRVGITPGDAEPVTVRDGVVYIGKNEAVDFNSGEPVRVPQGANPLQIRKALQDAEAVSKRQKFFGAGEVAVAPAPAPQQNPDFRTGEAATPSQTATNSTPAAPSQGAGSQQASAATPPAAPAAPSTTSKTKDAPPTGGEYLHGFMDGAAGIVRARVKKTLAGIVRNNGRLIARKALIEEEVAAGATVQRKSGERRLTGVDGTFLGEKEITQTGMDYAEHLIGKRAPAAPTDLQGSMAREGWIAETGSADNTIWTRSLESQRYTARLTPAAAGKLANMEVTVLVDGVDTQIAFFPVASHEEAAAQATKAVVDDLAQASAVHQDPGQPAEPATKPVVAESLKTAAAREQRPLADMRKDLLAQVDAAMETAKTEEDEDVQVRTQALEGVGQLTPQEQKEYKALSGQARDRWMKRRTEELSARAAAATERIGFVTFDVPGDGKFKVLNTRDRLLEFRKSAETSPGFKQPKRPAPAGNDGVQGGSTSSRTAVQNMVEEGDYQAALDYATVKGVSLDDLKLSKPDRKKLDDWLASNPQPTGEDAAEEVTNLVASPEPSPVSTPAPSEAATLRNDESAPAAPKKRAARAATATPAPAADPAASTTEDAGAELTYNRRNRVRSGLKWADVEKLDPALRVRETKKDKVYPRPDYEAMVNDGMEPLVAHIVKQVYDAIAVEPAVRGAPTDADLQTYIEGVNRYMKGVLEWANDGTRVGAWLTRIGRRASAYLGASKGAVTSLSSLTASGPEGVATLLQSVYGESWRTHEKEVRIIGGNKPLRALQPDTDEAVKAMKEIEKGWPGKLESWQKRGYWITDSSAVKADHYQGARAGNKEPYVYGHVILPAKNRHITLESKFFENTSDPAVAIAWAEARVAELRGKHLLLNKSNTLQGAFDTEAQAQDKARELTKRDGSGQVVDEKGTSVEYARRDGPAHRKDGENVTSEQLKDAFGFKGVNFGTWMKGKAHETERQLHLNHAFDSFMDLAGILGVPPKAMSLDGMLGLAIGAQGGGGRAAAHFVPGVNEINLTRTAGAGALAHEWGHALDHYFARQGGFERGSEPFLTEHLRAGGELRPEILERFKTIVLAMNKRQQTPEEAANAAKASMDRARSSLESWIKTIARDFAGVVDTSSMEKLFDRLRKGDVGEYVSSGGTALRSTVAALRDAYRKAKGRAYSMDNLKGLQSNADHLSWLLEREQGEKTHEPQLVSTEYAKEAAKLDKEKGGKAYWSTNLEKFARAFDAFVFSKVEERANTNTYLAGLNRSPETSPQGDERTAINTALQALVDTIETRDTDRGVAMFSRAQFRRGTEAAAGALDPTAIEAEVSRLTRDWLRKPDVHVLESMDEAPAKVREVWQRQNSAGGTGAIEGFHYRGGVYLVAEALGSVDDVRRVLFHEALGHFGLRGVFGDSLLPILRQLATMRPQLVARKAQQYGLDLSTDAGRVLAAEEVLAELAQTRPGLGWVQRAIAAIRRWLRAHGITMGLTDNDVIANYILPARGFVERGREANTEMADEEAQQSKAGGAEPFFSALEREVDQLPAKSLPTVGWLGTINGLVNKGAVKADEVEWSGIRDWLGMQQGKVPKEAVQAFLADNGVRVTEVLKGGEAQTSMADHITVQLDAAGFTVHRFGHEGEDFVLTRRADGARFIYSTQDDAFIREEDQEESDPRKLQEGDDSNDARAAWLGRQLDTLVGHGGDYVDELDSSTTRYGQYTLPGGENYREMLLTLPVQPPTTDKAKLEQRYEDLIASIGADPTGPKAATQIAERDQVRRQLEAFGPHGLTEGRKDVYKSSHWDEPNILAHIRMNDRTDAEGKRVLFIEELQSDWAQEGRRSGFVNDAARQKFNNLTMRLNELDDGPEREAVQRERDGIEKFGDTPRAPFVDKTDAWLGLALKRIVKYAADNGFDRVAFVNGQQSADRYDLSKHIGRVELTDNASGGIGDPDMDGPLVFGHLYAYGKDGREVMHHSVTSEQSVVDAVGKEVADRLLKAKADTIRRAGVGLRRRELSGLDLKVGGEGMIAFYEKIVPAALNKLLPKIGGGRVADVSFGDMKLDARERADGYWEIFEVATGKKADGPMLGLFKTKAAARGAISKQVNRRGGGPDLQPGFDVTPAMREAVVGGLPLFSRATIVGKTRQHTPEQERAMRNVGFQVEAPTLKERAQNLWQDAGKKLAQGIADQFRPVKDLDTKAYNLLRLSKGASGAFETLLHGGMLKLTDEVYDFDGDRRGGVVEKLLMPLQGEHHDFFRWVAANRAERLAAEGKENLFGADDIAALKTLATGDLQFDYKLQHGTRAGQATRDRAEAYADSLKTFNAFNRNVLDLAEQSGLIDGESRHLWEHEFYVPFYRVAEETEGGVRGASIKTGVVRQRAFEKLKGGRDKLNADLLDNTLLNWAHLLDASAKNRAAKATLEAAERLGAAIGSNEHVARQIGRATGNRGGVVWFMDKGAERFFVVEDPYLLTALTSLEYAGMRNPVMNAMGAFKHVLTVGVTASPFFKVRNLIRDSVQAIASGPLTFNPLANVAEGWKATNPKADTYFRLLAGGGTIHFGTMLEGSEAKRVQALVESGVDRSTILDTQDRVQTFYRRVIEPALTAYNELGNRGEAVNRAALYQQLLRQGKSHAEASLQARDLMDFSLQGSFTTVRFLTQVVPFMNARIQGLYKLGRAAKEDPARFSAVLGTTALVSLALLAAYGDDDDWKKREEWDRNNFWWFKIGGESFRIPKPFEIGAIATLAERGFELAFDKEMTGTRFRKQVLELLGDNLSMNPIPQLIKPVVDVYANKDSFTGRPIETMDMARLKADYRFTDRTSMTARGVSTTLNAGANLLGAEAVSPVQVDHMLRGYFGWLGSFIVGAGDVIARPATNQPAHPAPDYWKAVTGGMASSLEDAPSRYVSQMYDQAKEIERAYGTWRMLQKEGKTEEAAAFREDHQGELAKFKEVERVKRSEGFLNQRIRLIERNESLSPQEKAERIRQIRQQQDRVARLTSD